MTYIEHLKNHIQQSVQLKGWVMNTRASGKIKFLTLRDGTGICQCVFIKNESESSSFENFKDLSQECAVEVQGEVKKEPRSPGGYELLAQSYKIISPSKNFPITPKEHGTDFLMNHRHLWLRSKRQVAILRIRSEIVSAIRSYLDHKGFTLADTPIFTPNACEGTSTLFETNYFDEKVYLSQSGQLYSEAIAMALGKVYCFGPTFRAEKSKTRRHLIEFWMVEPEVAFADLKDNMELAESFVEYVVQRTLKNKEEELHFLKRNLKSLEAVKTPFPKIPYQEAAVLVKNENPHFNIGDDFGGTDETIISSKFDRPVFIYNYPKSVKAFYMKEDPNQPGESLSCDLLAPEGYGEIIGGGQREDDLNILKQKIKEHGLKEEDLSWYLDLRRFGSVPHSGFGMGLERCVTWICGLPHVREAIPFPRLYGRTYP